MNMHVESPQYEPKRAEKKRPAGAEPRLKAESRFGSPGEAHPDSRAAARRRVEDAKRVEEMEEKKIEELENKFMSEGGKIDKMNAMHTIVDEKANKRTARDIEKMRTEAQKPMGRLKRWFNKILYGIDTDNEV